MLGSLVAMVAGPAIGALIDVSGDVYRLAFLAGALLACLGLFAALRVNRRFFALGAPE